MSKPACKDTRKGMKLPIDWRDVELIFMGAFFCSLVYALLSGAAF